MLVLETSFCACAGSVARALLSRECLAPSSAVIEPAANRFFSFLNVTAKMATRSRLPKLSMDVYFRTLADKDAFICGNWLVWSRVVERQRRTAKPSSFSLSGKCKILRFTRTGTPPFIPGS